MTSGPVRFDRIEKRQKMTASTVPQRAALYLRVVLDMTAH
ncbi:hypothetical protein GGC47_005349 [Bosea sp. OAE752]